MFGLKVKRLQILVGRRLAIPDGNLYVDAHSGLTMRQRIGLKFLGGIQRLNRKAERKQQC